MRFGSVAGQARPGNAADERSSADAADGCRLGLGHPHSARRRQAAAHVNPPWDRSRINFLIRFGSFLEQEGRNGIGAGRVDAVHAGAIARPALGRRRRRRRGPGAAAALGRVAPAARRLAAPRPIGGRQRRRPLAQRRLPPRTGAGSGAGRTRYRPVNLGLTM